LQIVVQAVQAPEKQVVVHAVGLQADDLLILLDRQFQNALGTAARLHVAERAQINPSQQAAGFKIVGIALDDVLRLDHGVANAAGLGIELGESGGQVRGSRIGINGGAVFLDRLIRQFAAAVRGHLFLVHVREGKVVVGGGAVGRLALGAADCARWQPGRSAARAG
jgi:hypothetical protein